MRKVGVGEVGELYSRGPMLFDEYYKLPEKTAASFRGEWFSACDMARRDEDGFFEIVDRKDNLIITGGEHVFPSEVEEVIGSHECVFDCACISLEEVDEQIIKDCCKEKLAGYKRPKEVVFIQPDDMPRTSTGKILHRKLREELGSETEDKE
jgi:acyl-CoA synthetase (AMP-forming)/AMP-acid ligase II